MSCAHNDIFMNTAHVHEKIYIWCHWIATDYYGPTYPKLDNR